MTRPAERPQTAAADWFSLQRSGAMNADQEAALDAWLAESPGHRAAFEEVEFTWALMAAARDEPQMLGLRDAAERAHPRRRRLWLGGALAASVAAAAVIGWPVTSRWVDDAVPAAGQTFSTGIGQMTSMTLPDGTAVTLDADTVLRVKNTPTERLVTLEKGRAFFRVAADAARPFSLLADGKKVTAHGAEIDVNLANNCFELVLVEGKVKVADASIFRRKQAADLEAGARLLVEQRGRWEVTRANVERETSWLRGWLTYDREPMGSIAEDLNRHSRKKIVIRDPAVAATSMMGAFKPGDVEGFVRAARFYELAQVASETDETVVLVAPR